MTIRASQSLSTTINYTFTVEGATLDLAGLSLDFSIRGATSYGMTAGGVTGNATTTIADGELALLSTELHDGIVSVEGYSPVFVPVSVEAVATNYSNDVTVDFNPTAFDVETASPSEYVQSWNGLEGVVDFTDYTISVNGENGVVTVAESNLVTLNYDVNNLDSLENPTSTTGQMFIKPSVNKLYIYKTDSNGKDMRANFAEYDNSSGRITASIKGAFAEWTYTTSSFNAGTGLWTVDYNFADGVTFNDDQPVSVQIFSDANDYRGTTGDFDYLTINEFITFGDGTTQDTAGGGGNTGPAGPVGPTGPQGNTGPAAEGGGGTTLAAGAGVTLSPIVAGVGYTMSVDFNGAATNQVLYHDGTGFSGDNSVLFAQDANHPHLEADIEGKLLKAIKSDEALAAFDPVYITGNVGASDRVTVAKADASDSNKMPAAGIVTGSFSRNDEGYMVVTGLVRDADTSGFAANDTAFVGVGGGITAARPSGATDLIQNLGRVGRVHASTGTLLVLGAGRANDVPNLVHARAGISCDAGATFGGGIIVGGMNIGGVSERLASVADGDDFVNFGPNKFEVYQDNNRMFKTDGVRNYIGSSSSPKDLYVYGELNNYGMITAHAGITLGNGITFPDGTYQDTAGGSGGGGGSGGVASMDWIQDPDNTGTWRIFDDMLGNAPRTAAPWGSGVQNQSWAFFSNSDDGDIIGGYRTMMTTSAYARGGVTVPNLGKTTPSNGDKWLVEMRVKLAWGDEGDTNPQFSFGVFQGGVGAQDAVGPGYGSVPRAGIFVTMQGTEWYSYIRDSTAIGGTTQAVISPSVSASNNQTYNLACHGTYLTASGGWEMDWYIDGTLVHTSTLTAGTGCPFVRTNMESNGEAASSYYERYTQFDWINLQYTRPASITYLDIDDL